MYFHVEERRAWIRPHTHTVVYDRDPDYFRFSRDSTGKVKRMLRIWLAEDKEGRCYLLYYLGTVTFCSFGCSFRQLYRLFRLTSRVAKEAGKPPRILRRHLAGMLRKYKLEEYKLSEF